jgi:hypothetical protein
MLVFAAQNTHLGATSTWRFSESKWPDRGLDVDRGSSAARKLSET